MVNPVPTSSPTSIPPKPYIWIGVLFLLAGLLFLAKRNSESPVVYDRDGNIVLAPHRKEKLDRKLNELEEAEQYALFATENGFYPCFSCPDSEVIYLNKG
ncbi:MAG: hypothetical protein H6557_04100 [Lewinellaceae bacterium]|nr:hypothetical protein [Phaeodactylibacter sp.]MCB9035782.1 hypothetical protein [Lewinellaceae bacterium]